MTPNFVILFATAIIPLAISSVWYSSLLFGGDKWEKIAYIPEEKKLFSPIWKVMILFIFNFLIACGLYGICIHQSSVYSLAGGHTDLLETSVGATFIAMYGKAYLSFKHGAFHAVLATLMFVLPILMYITVFDKKGYRYFIVHFAFWLLSLSLMGGVIGMCGARFI